MKATKKPKRRNPYRSNVGFLNSYPINAIYCQRHGLPLPKPIGTVRVNRNGHQFVFPPPAHLLKTGPTGPQF